MTPKMKSAPVLISPVFANEDERKEHAKIEKRARRHPPVSKMEMDAWE
jgi:hypothetical protein